MKYRHILGGACCPLPNQGEIKFTGFVTGLTNQQDIISYIKGYINRPYDDLVAEATERNDNVTLRALGIGEYTSKNDFEWMKEQFPEVDNFDEPGINLFETIEDQNKEGWIRVGWFNSLYTFDYCPTDGHIEMQVYID